MEKFFFSAPGRTELAGNHTDHNFGKVLACSINLSSTAQVTKRSDNLVVFDSKGFEKICINLNRTEIVEEEKGTTKALIRGIASSILKRNGKVGGFEAKVQSSVTVGSGLSSSASIEVLIASIFNTLYCKEKFTPSELAVIGQEAENNFFGKPCGLMDQMACANGGVIKIDFSLPSDTSIKKIDFSFENTNYDLVIINTHQSHEDLTEEYASIPLEMKKVAAFFGKSVLGQCNASDFYSNLKEIRKNICNDRAILRAIHFFNENERVDKMAELLERKDGNCFDKYLELVRECGESSIKYLQNVYSNSNPKTQGLSTALALSEKFLKNEGAFRIQGGGFAGTVQVYVPKDRTQSFLKFADSFFGNKSACIIQIEKKSAGLVNQL